MTTDFVHHAVHHADTNTPNGSLNDGEMLRYSRQILLEGFDLEGQLNLKRACVLVLGVGGLGSSVLPILARAGVGQLHFVDNDTVDESNLQRQPLFFDKDIHQSKAASAHQSLSAHNPWVDLFFYHKQINADTLSALINETKPDLVLDCTDNFMARYAINQACIDKQKPLLSASAVGITGQLALFEPNTGCYACLFGTSANSDDGCVTSGVLASTVAVMASLQADAALKFLAHNINPLPNTMLLWQGNRLSLRKLHYQKNSRCAACGQPHNESRTTPISQP